MNILFISYTYWPPYFGGELLIAIKRLQDLTLRGHKVTAFTSGTSEYPRDSHQNGIFVQRSYHFGEKKFHKLLRIWWFNFRVIFKLLFLTETDIIHINSLSGIFKTTKYLNGIVIAKIAHWKKIKVVVVHSLADKKNAFFAPGYLGTKFFSNVDSIVCVSDGLYQAVRKAFPNKASKIVYGIQDQTFVPMENDQRSAFRHNENVFQEDIIFTFLGTISKRKGFDLIKNIFLSEGHRFLHWKLWVVGPYRKLENQNINEQEVSELIEPIKHMEERIKFWGRIDDRNYLAEILAASDIFLFPSRKEGFGIAPLEAMSAGVPPIIAKIPGVTDLGNIDHETGLYVSPGSQKELLDAMVKLAENQEVRERLGKQARKRIVDHFSWGKYIDLWEELYETLFV